MISRMTGYLTLAQSQSEVERLLAELVQAGVSKEKLETLLKQLCNFPWRVSILLGVPAGMILLDLCVFGLWRFLL